MMGLLKVTRDEDGLTIESNIDITFDLWPVLVVAVTLVSVAALVAAILWGG